MLPSELHKTALKYLETLGCTPVDETDPNSHWHVRIDYPMKSPHVMHVVAPKQSAGAIVIASSMILGNDLLKAFEALDEASKEDFLYELRKALNSTEADFQMIGMEGPTGFPQSIQVSVVRYADGLTMDSFARSVGAVYKIELGAALVIQRHLGQNGFGTGGRFDFKRLGI